MKESENVLSVVIADDHPIFRHGLRDLIAASEEYHVAAEFEDGQSAWEYIREFRPDIAILDVEMPGLRGLDIARNIQYEQIPVRTIILTMFDEVELLDNAMRHGVLGYILKDTAIAEVMRGLDNVRHGNPYISTRLLDKVVNRRHSYEVLTGERAGIQALSPAERQVLRMIGRNKSTKEIASELSISVRTVEHHRSNICRKLGLEGPYALLRFALENRERF